MIFYVKWKRAILIGEKSRGILLYYFLMEIVRLKSKHFHSNVRSHLIERGKVNSKPVVLEGYKKKWIYDFQFIFN